MKALARRWLAAARRAHLLGGWWTIRTRFAKLTQAQREAEVQRWAAGFLRVWRIDLQVRGTPPAGGPLMLVANHIPWLDIRSRTPPGSAALSPSPTSWASALAHRHHGHRGGHALHRARLAPRRTARGHHDARCAAARRGGRVFPEGTTSDGRTLLPFHANLIQAAISAQSPVPPVALEFVDMRTGAISMAPIYIGDQAWAARCGAR